MAVTDISEAGAIKLIPMSGTPYERGVTHGRQIAGLFASYWDEVLRSARADGSDAVSESQVCAWVRDQAGLVVSAFPDLDDEVRGIADGADVPYEAALSVAIDQGTLTEYPGGGKALVASVRGARRPSRERCLSVLVPGEYTTTGQTLLAQTWDNHDPSIMPEPFVVAFVIESSDGSRAFLSDPGWIGGAGVNDRGVGSVHTGVWVKHDQTHYASGIPYPYVARAILEAPDVEAAVASIVSAPTTGGGPSTGDSHYVISDGAQFTDVESAGDVKAVLRSQGTVFATCAHFTEAKCVEQEGAGPAERLVSAHRVARVSQLAWHNTPVSPLDLFGVLSDHTTGPGGGMVCMHGLERESSANPYGIRLAESWSSASIVVDPSGQTIWAKAGTPCCERPITEIRLEPGGFTTRVVGADTATTPRGPVAEASARL
jgi:isopenicillin-N N-acyltransferase-like protein